MDGRLSQMIALVSAVHGGIAGNAYDTQDVLRHNLFAYCNTVSFFNSDGGVASDDEKPQDIGQWLSSVIQAGVKGAWLDYESSSKSAIPDHQMVAFANGGGAWNIVLSFADHMEVWDSNWRVRERRFFMNRNRLWNVTYRCIHRSSEVVLPPPADLFAVEKQLAASLLQIRDFAAEHKLSNWTNCFELAYQALQSERDPLESLQAFLIYRDCCPSQASRLLSASAKAWVFGGMGSWNDLIFKTAVDHEEYERLSSELYLAIMNAIRHACSAFTTDVASRTA
jgi:hypothetical protein